MSDPDHPPPHTWDLRATGKVECIWEGCNQIPTQAEHSAALQQAETAMGGRFLIDWRFPAALPSDRRPAEADRWVTIALAASDDADNGPIDLYMVMVHGRAAGERARAAMAAGSRERRESLVEPLRATAFAEVAGATAHATLSFFLASSAAERYCDANDEPGPLGRRRLREAVQIATHLRNAVMHWDDKLKADPETTIAVSETAIVVIAPPGAPWQKTDTVVTMLTWRDLVDWSNRLEFWATYKLQEARQSENGA